MFVYKNSEFEESKLETESDVSEEKNTHQKTIVMILLQKKKNNHLLKGLKSPGMASELDKSSNSGIERVEELENRWKYVDHQPDIPDVTSDIDSKY